MTALEKFIFTFFHWETALAAFPDVLKGAVVTVVLGLLTAVAASQRVSVLPCCGPCR